MILFWFLQVHTRDTTERKSIHKETTKPWIIYSTGEDWWRDGHGTFHRRTGWNYQVSKNPVLPLRVNPNHDPVPVKDWPISFEDGGLPQSLSNIPSFDFLCAHFLRSDASTTNAGSNRNNCPHPQPVGPERVGRDRSNRARQRLNSPKHCAAPRRGTDPGTRFGEGSGMARRRRVVCLLSGSLRVYFKNLQWHH